MSLVANKYTQAEVSEAELEATFAARGHTVDYLLKALRDQVGSGTLSSFVVLGPRGAGKSTIIRMIDLRLRQDTELSAAWLPVVFPEEQFGVTSLRDLLAATLAHLAQQDVTEAAGWHEKIEAESDDEQSLQVGITALRTISRTVGKRLVLFIENLNLLLEEAFSDQEKGTLRRLLMTDPFMMVIGSAVHVFDALKRYDEAFFNYFAPVSLPRLSAEQVFELLERRAAYDGNERFKQVFPQSRPRIRAIVQLSGGNPRLVLMLYELLSQRHVTSIVDQLRRLVDELTPLLKDEVEWLPPQQRKIIHALMEKGGTAQPADLVALARLPLGTITAQLRRLKEAQMVELLGGGKGRRASYTVPDQLFVIWYQMRYLRKNRRRIELFVEVLRVWFEAEERAAVVREMAAANTLIAPGVVQENAWVSEYYAASLKGTAHEAAARDLAIEQWLRTGDLREAAAAFADLFGLAALGLETDNSERYLALGRWCLSRRNLDDAFQIADRVVRESTSSVGAVATAHFIRGFCHTNRGELPEAIQDCTSIAELDGAPVDFVVLALFDRGLVKTVASDMGGALDDYTAAIDFPGAPVSLVAKALFNRGSLRERNGFMGAAICDYTQIIKTQGSPLEVVARAFAARGRAKALIDDREGASSDLQACVDLKSAINSPLVRVFADVAAIGWVRGRESDALAVIDHLIGMLGFASGQTQSRAVVDFLSQIASFGELRLWMYLWRALKTLPSAAAESALAPFAAVTEVLEHGDRSVLEPLPPEQREFAETILKRFEPPPVPPATDAKLR